MSRVTTSDVTNVFVIRLERARLSNPSPLRAARPATRRTLRSR